MRPRDIQWHRVTGLLFLLLLPALLLVFLTFERGRGIRQLAALRASLVAKGAWIEPGHFPLPQPIRSNGAPYFRQAVQQLNSSGVAPGALSLRMSFTESGAAIAGHKQDNWVSRGTYCDWRQASDYVASNYAALVLLHDALGAPEFDNQLAYGLGAFLSLQHLANTRYACGWLGLQAQLTLREHRLDEALESMTDQLKMLRTCERDGLSASEVFRTMYARQACAITWEALQVDGWTDAQLAALQKAWEEPQFLSALPRALRYEQTFGPDIFNLCRRSNTFARDLIFSSGIYQGARGAGHSSSLAAKLKQTAVGKAVLQFIQTHATTPVWRFAWSHQCEAKRLESTLDTQRIAAGALRTKDWSWVDRELQSLRKSFEISGVYDKLRFPAVLFDNTGPKRLFSRVCRAETERSLVVAAIALKRNSLAGEMAPTSLAQLKPKYLAQVPLDYMSGTVIKYSRLSNTNWLLYSVGDNGSDDHGDCSPNPNAPKPQAEWWDRKDCVWPCEATPDEIAAWRKGSAQPQ